MKQHPCASTKVVDKEYFSEADCADCGDKFMGGGKTQAEADGDLQVQLQNHRDRCRKKQARRY